MEGLYTELQAGSYLFMDAVYRNLNLPFQNALFLLSTVVSQKGDLTVLDAGLKTCGVDQGMPAPREGTVREIVASEEHFQLHGGIVHGDGQIVRNIVAEGSDSRIVVRAAPLTEQVREPIDQHLRTGLPAIVEEQLLPCSLGLTVVR